MVTIKVEGVIATLKNEKWECKDRIMKSILETFSYEDIKGYSPFPDLTLAEMVVKELKGMIIKITDTPKPVEGRVY